MPYIAYVGIKLKWDFQTYEKDKWYPLKRIGHLDFRWRFTSDYVYEVISGTFVKKDHALIIAKYMYTTAFLNIMCKDFPIVDNWFQFYGDELYHPDIYGDYDKFIDNLFLFERNKVAAHQGLFVVEVERTIDDFRGISFNSGEGYQSVIGDVLSFNNYDCSGFQYNREAQQIYNTIIRADNSQNLGIQMTLYCGLLEHLAKDSDKEAEVISEIDELISHVEGSNLSKEQKNSLIVFLTSGKKTSARKKCRDFVEKYGRKQYGEYLSKDIINAAYGIRSTFSHGDNAEKMYGTPASHMKALVIDVVYRYMHEKDQMPVIS